jgi:dipeptidase E
MTTRKIMIVGGGEMGRPGTKIETEKIDKEIIRLSGKKNPKLLFLPTATQDSEGYVKVINGYFGERLGCKIDTLLLYKEKLSKKQIEEKIFGSDIIYVGGGNTLNMMNKWRELGVDKILKQAYSRGIVLSGISAGGICWFKYGQSDSLKTEEDPYKLTIVKGLGLIKALHAPHFTREKYRHASLKELTKEIQESAIALEDCCAMEIVDDSYRIITSDPKTKAKAYKCYWKSGKYHKEIIPQLKEFSELEELFRK